MLIILGILLHVFCHLYFFILAMASTLHPSQRERYRYLMVVIIFQALISTTVWCMDGFLTRTLSWRALKTDEVTRTLTQEVCNRCTSVGRDIHARVHAEYTWYDSLVVKERPYTHTTHTLIERITTLPPIFLSSSHKFRCFRIDCAVHCCHIL